MKRARKKRVHPRVLERALRIVRDQRIALDRAYHSGAIDSHALNVGHTALAKKEHRIQAELQEPFYAPGDVVVGVSGNARVTGVTSGFGGQPHYRVDVERGGDVIHDVWPGEMIIRRKR